MPLRTTWEGKFFRPTWYIGQILVRETCLSLALNICPAVQNWLLLGVEDTVDVKQKGTKGQKNEKNNRFVMRCSIRTCPVSSTPRRSRKISMKCLT